MNLILRPILLALATAMLGSHAIADVPQSVTELWADFDPRKDPIDAQVIREWKEDGGVYRHVSYHIGTFKGQPARMVAIYGFPEDAKEKLPAVMHIHGGGQRAFLAEVQMLVRRGYAALSVNWGGNGDGEPPFNSPDGAQPGDPNTDWGAVDPSQLNVQGYGSMLPGPKQFFEDREHPKNNNWYLLTLGCRRGLTFLEQQPEVDPARLGVHGYSMGGNLTMYVAGTDDRVRAAVPGVGGQGWRWQAHEFTEGTAAPQVRVQGDVEVYRKTLAFESYSPLIQCPVLHRSGTNDFHGWMDDVYRTNALIPNQPTRYSWSPHLNHGLIPEVAVAMPLWLDHFLKGGPALPETPASELTLKSENGVPAFRVVPDSTWPVTRCEIYYSVDSDPRARFWRSADVTRDGDSFTAKLPLQAKDLPLFAFANVYHKLPQPESLAPLRGLPDQIDELCLSSLLHAATADDLAAAQVKATQIPTRVIDDFSHGLRDWYVQNANHPSLRHYWTRKVTDPVWRGRDGEKLVVTVKAEGPTRVTVEVRQNEWRDYRGKRKTFTATQALRGDGADRVAEFQASDLVESTEPKSPLDGWSELDQLGIRLLDPEPGASPAELIRVEWK